jgi:hypothetical protein
MTALCPDDREGVANFHCKLAVSQRPKRGDATASEYGSLIAVVGLVCATQRSPSVLASSSRQQRRRRFF